MCGFAGIVLGEGSAVSIHQKVLDHLEHSLVHRGPDAGGQWLSSDRSVALVNRRLKIIDLSIAGAMPMERQALGLIISYNGEIYNYKSLRAELEVLGYLFASHSDTETILYAYHAWGIACLKKLDGIFAFALFDQRSNELFLVRDRMGVKPLYFTQQAGVFSFASEIKALWCLPWNTKQLSAVALYHYLTFMVSPAPYTAYEQVYKLPAGFYAKIDAARAITFHEWYSPLENESGNTVQLYNDEQFCVETIRSLLIQSAQKRMVADVPVGALLSGGLDSSLAVALMAYTGSTIQTFTVGFADGPEHDEMAWARLVAEQFGTQHHELLLSEQEAFTFYEQMVYQLDEPLADCVCIPFYYVTKLARDCNIHVVQVGEGADELFFGYPSYGRQAAMQQRLWNPAQRYLAQPMRSIIAKTVKPFLPSSTRYSELLQSWVDGKPVFWSGAIAFSEYQKRSVMHDPGEVAYDATVAKIYPGLRQTYDSYSFVDYHLKQLHERMPQADFGQQCMYLELKQRLPELLLMRADKMAMANSVEAREPYLDYRLVEFLLQVPLSLKFKHGITKYLLKKVAHGLLPDVIINRKKLGFGAPTARWFNQGELFPQYFNAVKQKTWHPAQEAMKIKLLQALLQEHPSVAAVQKWVLQQLWALW